jgi:hypothetical protein
MAWTIAAIITLLLIPGWIERAAGPFINEYVTNRMSYSSGMMLILVAPVFPLVGTLAAQTAAIRARRRVQAPH